MKREPKAGDRVRIVGDRSHHNLLIGSEHTLLSMSDSSYYSQFIPELGSNSFVVKSEDTNSGDVCIGIYDFEVIESKHER